jgi:hypothetical protein
MTKRIPIYLVEWADSMGQGGTWTRCRDMTHAAGRMASVGRIVYEDDDVVTISGHWDHQEPPYFDGALTIPKYSIVRRWRLCTLEAK